MSDLRIRPAWPDALAAATAIPRLPLPMRRLATERPADQPALIGRWLEAKVNNGDLDALSPAEREDLRVAALMLEAGTHPGVVSRSWFWRFWP